MLNCSPHNWIVVTGDSFKHCTKCYYRVPLLPMNGAGEFEELYPVVTTDPVKPPPPSPTPPTHQWDREFEIMYPPVIVDPVKIPPPPPIRKWDKFLEEIASLPRDDQERLYRFLHDACDCRIILLWVG